MDVDFIEDVLFHLVRLIPLVLPLIWMAGALVFYFREERRSRRVRMDRFRDTPISVLLPCYNEEKTVTNTILSLDRLHHPDLEIIAINDGSRDRTQEVLEKLALQRPGLRVLNLLQNRGKAAALSLGLLSCRHEFVLCIDADSEVDPDAPAWMLRHFRKSDIAAVTGNPRVKNRGTLVGRLQVGEFSALVGMIKRYHQSLGKLFALSGVLVMFRKSAVIDVGLWDTDTVTEDIGISWKLQTAGWNLKYEPRAICDVLMPDTIKGLWRQRFRWARGGFEVITKHARGVITGPDVGLKLLLLEYSFSVLWVFALPVTIVLHLFHILTWTGPLSLLIFVMGLMSLIQFGVGLFLHGKYERAGALSYWSIWYPFVYWMLNSAVLFVAVPKVLFGRRNIFSSWVSPDRGGITYAQNN